MQIIFLFSFIHCKGPWAQDMSAIEIVIIIITKSL